MDRRLKKRPWYLTNLTTLTTQPGAIYEGQILQPDCVFILADEDFVALVNGDADPQFLFMQVKISEITSHAIPIGQDASEGRSQSRQQVHT